MRSPIPLTTAAIAVICTTALTAGAQTARRSDVELVQALRGTSVEAKQGAVLYVKHNIPAAERSASSEGALIEELSRLNRVAEQRVEADRAGKLVGDFPGEYHADLIEVVGQSANAATIPALAGALGTGRLVENGLSKFGDAAVPTLLQVAGAKVGSVTTGAPGDTPPYVVAGALDTLSQMFAKGVALSPNSRQQIVAAAGQRLVGVQDPSVICAAVSLAVKSKDAALRQRVQQIAADPRQLSSMGVSDTTRAGMVVRAAQEALQSK